MFSKLKTTTLAAVTAVATLVVGGQAWALDTATSTTGGTIGTNPSPGRFQMTTPGGTNCITATSQSAADAIGNPFPTAVVFLNYQSRRAGGTLQFNGAFTTGLSPWNVEGLESSNCGYTNVTNLVQVGQDQPFEDEDYIGATWSYVDDQGQAFDCEASLRGQTDTVATLQCIPVVANQPPTANAGPDQTVGSGTSPVTLDGTGSLTGQGQDEPDQTLTYAWTQTDGPSVDDLSSTTAARPTFTAPTLLAGDDSVTLTFSLVVEDNLGLASTADTVTITVTAPDNQAPTANAGPDQTVGSGTSPVTLDGTGSLTGQGQDEPDQTLTYAWTQTDGPSVDDLSSTTAASPTFTAPTLLAGDDSVTLTFSLVVEDNLGLASTADTVTITVVAGLPVVVSGGPDAITGTDPFTVTVTFAKPVTGFNDLTNDVIVANGAVSAITGGPAVYTLTIVPTGNGDVSISIPAGAAQEVRTDGFVNLNSVSNVLVIGNRIVEITQEQIASFMLGRANNLATNQPGLTRFLMGEGCGSFNASATQDGSSLDGCVVQGNTWAEITSTSSGDGSYTLGAVGVHRFANPDLLFGGMIQFDYTDDPAKNASGRGWLVGPYFVAKIPDQPLYFEGRLLYGQTDNEITPLGTYTDSFDTERWLAQVRATGEYEAGDTILMPLLDFTYTEDQQKAYTDSLGNTIPGQTVDLMQLSTGLDFTTPIPVETGSLELAGGISGIYSSSNGAATAPEFEDWRGRTHLGLNYDTGTGTTLSISGFYDGLGTSYESYGASLTANIRF